MTTSPLEALTRAKEIVQKGWCQGTYARSMEGFEVPLSSRHDGCSFCIRGAMIHACVGDAGLHRAIDGLAYTVCLEVHACGLVEFNDAKGRKVEEVVELLDKVISRLEDEVECIGAVQK